MIHIVQNEYPTLSFTDSHAWRAWLSSNYGTVDGMWLQIYKKDSGIKTVTYPEALDEALCFGWIDGQKKSYDQVSFLQKFTPRRKRSIWSQRNIAHVHRLTAEGKMTPAGQTEIEAAKQDGRWDQAYASHATMRIPDDFTKKVRTNPAAYATFKTLSKSELYSIYFTLHTAKSVATRERRIEKMLKDLER